MVRRGGVNARRVRRLDLGPLDTYDGRSSAPPERASRPLGAASGRSPPPDTALPVEHKDPPMATRRSATRPAPLKKTTATRTRRAPRTAVKARARQLNDAPVGNALIGQSGGATVGINQSLVGGIESAVAHPNIKQVFGARHGVAGILADDLIRLDNQPRKLLETVALTPAAALGSVRKKPTREECLAMFETFRKHDIAYLFYIGGNDSAEMVFGTWITRIGCFSALAHSSRMLAVSAESLPPM